MWIPSKDVKGIQHPDEFKMLQGGTRARKPADRESLGRGGCSHFSTMWSENASLKR